MTELLAPAGGEQSAYIALEAGADAVYLGLSEFSARAGAENFDVAALERTTRFAHILGAKVYVALNTLVKDGELSSFFALAKQAWEAGADAILIQDMLLGKALKEQYPEIVLHLSTQAGCCNAYGAELARKSGFSRAVLARETPLDEIRKISSVIETEVFVQGALCTCFSGQCYFSSFAGNMSGNRGRCKQPCRKRYAISRRGFEEEAYALSLADLCVGERVEELLAAGVTSLKIEGRMRRAEYTAAAVAYYKKLLNGESASEQFTALKRAYNRGDYTAGLAFGQDKTLLSRDVQGHIGERVGSITLRGGKYFCKSDYVAGAGDGFKILRDKKEVGGAMFSALADGGFYLRSNCALTSGDEVRLTTSALGGAATMNFTKKRRKLEIEVECFGGVPPVARCGSFEYRGETPLEKAQRAPLTEADIAACFFKVGTLPISPSIRVRTADAFLPKSALNAFRREFYAALAEELDPKRAPLPDCEIFVELPADGKKQTAKIVADGCAFVEQREDILIYKPSDYARLDEKFFAVTKEKYLYLPPYFTAADEDVVKKNISRFDGIYCEGYYGFALAKKYGVSLFAGTGCNLFNRLALNEAYKAGAKYLALSKELSTAEQAQLSARGVFVLTAGEIKVMDLIYCPFSRTCGGCDQRSVYELTDESGRKFPLRRYRVSGGYCRFEVYNCVPLLGERANCSALHDDSLLRGRPNAGGTTSGHTKRSVL